MLQPPSKKFGTPLSCMTLKYIVLISVLRVIFRYKYIESEVLSVKIELMDYIVVPIITSIN